MMVLMSNLCQRRNREEKIEQQDCFEGHEILPPLYEEVKKTLKLSGKEWEEMVKLMNNHPLVKQMCGHPHEGYVSETRILAREAA
jgi:hypothetical protein